jgi:hypothetical protein
MPVKAFAQELGVVLVTVEKQLLDNFPDITALLSRFAASEELKH